MKYKLGNIVKAITDRLENKIETMEIIRCNDGQYTLKYLDRRMMSQQVCGEDYIVEKIYDNISELKHKQRIDSILDKFELIDKCGTMEYWVSEKVILRYSKQLPHLGFMNYKDEWKPSLDIVENILKDLEEK